MYLKYLINNMYILSSSDNKVLLVALMHIVQERDSEQVLQGQSENARAIYAQIMQRIDDPENMSSGQPGVRARLSDLADLSSSNKMFFEYVANLLEKIPDQVESIEWDKTLQALQDFAPDLQPIKEETLERLKKFKTLKDIQERLLEIKKKCQEENPLEQPISDFHKRIKRVKSILATADYNQPIGQSLKSCLDQTVDQEQLEALKNDKMEKHCQIQELLERLEDFRKNPLEDKQLVLEKTKELKANIFHLKREYKGIKRKIKNIKENPQVTQEYLIKNLIEKQQQLQSQQALTLKDSILEKKLEREVALLDQELTELKINSEKRQSQYNRYQDQIAAIPDNLLLLKKRIKRMQRDRGKEISTFENQAITSVIKCLNAMTAEKAVFEQAEAHLKVAFFKEESKKSMRDNHINPFIRKIQSERESLLNFYRSKRKVIENALNKREPVKTADLKFNYWHHCMLTDLDRYGLRIGLFLEKNLEKIFNKIVERDLDKFCIVSVKNKSIGDSPNGDRDTSYWSILVSLNQMLESIDKKKINFSQKEVEWIRQIILTQLQFELYVPELIEWPKLKEEYLTYKKKTTIVDEQDMIKACLLKIYKRSIEQFVTDQNGWTSGLTLDACMQKIENHPQNLLKFCLDFKISPKCWSSSLEFLFSTAQIPKSTRIPVLSGYQTETMPKKEKRNSGYLFFEKIEQEDLGGLLIGDLMGSCLHAGGKSRECVIDALNNPNSGLYLITERNNDLPPHPIPIWRKDIKKEKPVALIYAWRSTNDNLVFDSIEIISKNQKSEYAQPVKNLLTKVAASFCATTPTIDRVLVGIGGKTSIVFEEAAKQITLSPEIMMEHQKQHLDSEKQLCIAQSLRYQEIYKEIKSGDQGFLENWVKRFEYNSSWLELMKAMIKSNSSESRSDTDQSYQLLRNLMSRRDPDKKKQIGNGKHHHYNKELESILREIFNRHMQETGADKPLNRPIDFFFEQNGQKTLLLHWLLTHHYDHYKDFVHYLMDKMPSAYCNCCDEDGHTFLHLAADRGDKANVSALLLKGASETLKDKKNLDWKSYAEQGKNRTSLMIRECVESEAETEAETGDNKTKYLSALKRRQKEIEDFIKERTPPTLVAEIDSSDLGTQSKPPEREGSPISVTSVAEIDSSDLGTQSKPPEREGSPISVTSVDVKSPILMFSTGLPARMIVQQEDKKPHDFK